MAAGRRRSGALRAHIDALEGVIPAAFVPGCNLNIAATLVAGCDVWLNTPLPPLEASGTSGMKAALNGVLNLSVLHGWWFEGCVDGVTGWSNPSNGAPRHAMQACFTTSCGMLCFRSITVTEGTGFG